MAKEESVWLYMQLVEVKIKEVMKNSRGLRNDQVIGQAMWYLGAVLIVGVTLVMLFKGNIPFVLGTPKLGIVLWDLVYHGHFCKWSKCLLLLLNSWIDIHKNMFIGWIVGVEDMLLGCECAVGSCFVFCGN